MHMPDPFDPFANTHGPPQILSAGDSRVRVEDLIYANGEFKVILRVDVHADGTVTLKWLDLSQGVVAGQLTRVGSEGVYIRRKVTPPRGMTLDRACYEKRAGTDLLPDSVRDALWHEWVGSVDSMQLNPEGWYQRLSRLALLSFKQGVKVALADEQAAQAWAAED